MANLAFFDNGIYSSPSPPITFPSDPNLSMVPFLFRNAHSYPDRPALIDADSAESLTFRGLQSYVASFSAALSSIKIKKGDVVLIFAPNSIHFPVCLLAILSLGAIVTTVNPSYTVTELSKQADDSGAKLVITVPRLLPRAKTLGLPIVLIGPKDSTLLDGTISFYDDMIETPLSDIRPVEIRQTDVAALIYSSGTTGTNKGAVLTHRNFICVSLMLSADQDRRGDASNRFLCFLPMFHMFGLSTITYAQLQRGNSLVVMERFDMEKMLRWIDKYGVTHLYVVPPVMIRLAKRGKVSEYDVGSLRWICCGAAPLGSDVMEVVSKNLPAVEVVQLYALTESSGIMTMELPEGEARQFGSTGSLASGIEAKVVSIDTCKALAPNQQGELWFRGPNIMQGYYNNHEATKLTLDDKGWLHTGDLGYFDERGQLFIVDRIKEMIKCKGFQVAPAEIEGVLISHPEILDAAVIPQEDAEAGQVPIAFVVRSPISSLNEVDIQKFVETQVAPFKRLRRVIFDDRIPKNPSGKILRRELIEKAKNLNKNGVEWP